MSAEALHVKLNGLIKWLNHSKTEAQIKSALNTIEELFKPLEWDIKYNFTIDHVDDVKIRQWVLPDKHPELYRTVAFVEYIEILSNEQINDFESWFPLLQIAEKFEFVNLVAYNKKHQADKAVALDKYEDKKKSEFKRPVQTLVLFQGGKVKDSKANVKAHGLYLVKE